MFEKSLYDLIRGLRNHKGNEREYIQDSLRECRKEIKGQDMDLKAIALLKLTYLEMFGHDMSWASFHVLEVMSSQKYPQKRVGYLGAVQSFRPDTEVLVLAENLLKKDLTSPLIPTISLPLNAIPHVISPSMANSLLSDLLPRLTHSHPVIRKKTIVTLYRLALVYPETLRPAWPKIKERLSDSSEDPSVTAAIVNVVCELSWRRPQDFLPLAPRLFELLVEGKNNWMAIKIIKLFATLTPLEPRLVKKLLPPLTTIIKETPAMSLLYECIHGIIQGGVLKSIEGTKEGEDIARLCITKLRGMLVVEGDPNLKYVALLALNQVVESHPYLVALHEDVILECIDDADISIRLRALDLVVGMVNSDNLMPVVGRLMLQLRNSPVASSADDPFNDRSDPSGVMPTADSDDEDAQQSIKRGEQKSNQAPPLPDDYRINIIRRIVEMCSRNTYINISDFDWYIDVLVQLTRHVPAIIGSRNDLITPEKQDESLDGVQDDVAHDIGEELRNVAVRVKSSRREVTRAAELLVAVDRREQMLPFPGSLGVLEPAIWIVGEYPEYLGDARATLNSIMHPTTVTFSPRTLAAYVQAAVKVFSSMAGNEQYSWTRERQSQVSLLISRIINFLEPLNTHPSLEVQERAVEFLELTRLANEAIAAHAVGPDYGSFADPPLLLTQAMPSLFSGMELKPVARDAQRKVPIPEELDLDKFINDDIQTLLQVPDLETGEDEDDEFYQFYNQRPREVQANQPAAARLEAPEIVFSYQQGNGEYLDPDVIAARRAERRERHKDDPFYIPSEETSRAVTPLMNNHLKTSNGEDIDIDSIPIMELNLDGPDIAAQMPSKMTAQPKPRRHFEILSDESIGDDLTTGDVKPASRSHSTSRAAKSLLQVDSSGLGTLSLDGEVRRGRLDVERREAEEAEMAKAMQEVERLRLEMQRASERVEVKNGPAEGVVVKRKKKKSAAEASAVQGDGEPAKIKKKKKKVKVSDEHGLEIIPEVTGDPAKKGVEEPTAVVPETSQTTEQSKAMEPKISTEAQEPSPRKKKTKRRQVTFDEADDAPGA